MLLHLATPERLFEWLPRVWRSWYKGIEIEAERCDGGGVLTVRGPGRHVPYLAPGTVGWMELVWQHIGSRLQIYEESWLRGDDRADPLVFHLDWRPDGR
jgi:hypothetical protein